MQYQRISADCHLDIIWLPPDLFTSQAAREAMLTGRRYTGPEAVAAGIVRTAVPSDSVLPTAMEIASGQAALDGSLVGRIRREMYPDVLAALKGPLF